MCWMRWYPRQNINAYIILRQIVDTTRHGPSIRLALSSLLTHYWWNSIFLHLKLHTTGNCDTSWFWTIRVRNSHILMWCSKLRTLAFTFIRCIAFVRTHRGTQREAGLNLECFLKNFTSQDPGIKLMSFNRLNDQAQIQEDPRHWRPLVWLSLRPTQLTIA